MLGKLLAEAIGTFWLVLGGCGSAVLAAAYPDLGIGFLGVSLAFGLTAGWASQRLEGLTPSHISAGTGLRSWQPNLTAGGRRAAAQCGLRALAFFHWMDL